DACRYQHDAGIDALEDLLQRGHVEGLFFLIGGVHCQNQPSAAEVVRRRGSVDGLVIRPLLSTRRGRSANPSHAAPDLQSRVTVPGRSDYKESRRCWCVSLRDVRITRLTSDATRQTLNETALRALAEIRHAPITRLPHPGTVRRPGGRLHQRQ